MEKSSTDLKAFFYHNPSPAWILELSSAYIVEVNEAALLVYQYNREDFLNLQVGELIEDDGLAQLNERLKVSENAEAAFQIPPCSHRKKDGTTFQMEINAFQLDFEGKTCIAVQCREVSDQENTIRAAGNLHIAAEIRKIGYWKYDLKKDKLTWSPEVYRIWNTVEGGFNVTFDAYYQTIHPDDRAAFDKVKDAVFKGEQSQWNFKYRIVLPDGNMRWIHEMGRSITDEAGSPILLEGTLKDISHQQEEELRLRLLEGVITHTNDAILITDAEWLDEPGPRIIYVNEGFTKLTGYTSEEAVGKTPRILHGPKSDRKELEKLKKSLQKGEPCEITTINYGKNGNEYWINLSVAPVRNAQGQITHFTAIQRDVTLQKNTEHELAKKTKLLATLAEVNATLLKSESWLSALHDSFDVIGKSLDVSRIYYFERHKDAQTGAELFSQKYEWYSGDALPQIDNPDLQNIPGDAMPDFVVPLIEEKWFSGVVSLMPDSNLKQLLLSQDIKSILILPILNEAGMKGFVGFDDCVNERLWTSDEVYFLRSFTSNLSIIMQREIHQDTIEGALEEKIQILEGIQDAFFALDHHENITYWNKEAEHFSKYPREKTIGKNLWAIFPTGKDLQFYNEYHKLKSQRISVHFEQFSTVAQQWFEVTGYPTTEGSIFFFRLITDRKQEQIKLQQANDRFEKVSEATNDAIWDWNVEENTLYWGGGFEKLFGHTADKITPTLDRWKSRIHPDDYERVLGSLQEVLDHPSETYWEAEYRYVKADGSYAQVIDRGIVIRDEEGKVIRMVGAVNDITRLKEHERELEKLNQSLQKQANELKLSNEELEQFAYVASHDLQEPLRMITGFMQQLEKKYAGQLDDKSKQYIHFATDGAKRMKKIIMDLLDYSRAGKFTESQEKVSLDEILSDYLILRRIIIEEKRAKLIYTDLGHVRCRKAPLVQVMHSLLDNALKFTPEDVYPEVHIAIEEKSKEWVISIKDNGIGIDPKHYDNIFIIFKRLHTNEQFSGTGIGLAVAKKQIESWGGEIWLESALKVGTSFFFTIPKT